MTQKEKQFGKFCSEMIYFSEERDYELATINTTSGDVICDVVGGDVHTVSGDIHRH